MKWSLDLPASLHTLPNAKHTEMILPPVEEKRKLTELSPPPANGQEKVERLRWRLSRNVAVDITLTGTKITAKDIEMLCKYVNLLKEALGDDVIGELEQKC